MAAVIRGPEGDDRLQRRASGHRAGHLRHEHRGFHRELEKPSGPALNGLTKEEEGGVGVRLSKQHNGRSLTGLKPCFGPISAHSREGRWLAFAYYRH